MAVSKKDAEKEGVDANRDEEGRDTRVATPAEIPQNPHYRPDGPEELTPDQVQVMKQLRDADAVPATTAGDTAAEEAPEPAEGERLSGEELVNKAIEVSKADDPDEAAEARREPTPRKNPRSSPPPGKRS